MRSRVSEEKKAFARHLRRNPTNAAARLWSRLRATSLGFKFRRRAILYGWIVDFWCPSAAVAIEIDYTSDVYRADEHSIRDGVLADHGIRVVRVPVGRVFSDLERVLQEIREVCTSRSEASDA